MLDWMDIMGIACGSAMVFLFRFALRNSVRQTVSEELEQWRKSGHLNTSEHTPRPLSFSASHSDPGIHCACNRDLYR